MVRSVTALWLCWGTATIAGAQDAPGNRPGEVEFQVGVTYYDAGRFLEAARAFEQSYAASRAPEILYNVYVAYRDAGRIDEAAAALRQYLRDAREVRERAVLESRLRSLEQQIAERDAGHPVAQPNPDPPPAAPVADPTPDPDPPVDDGGSSAPVVPWILMGAGGVALIASGVLGLTVMSTYDDLESMCGTERLCPVELEDERDGAQTRAIFADVLLGIGVVSAGIGLVLLVAGGGDDESERAVACGPTGCAARWSF